MYLCYMLTTNISQKPNSALKYSELNNLTFVPQNFQFLPLPTVIRNSQIRNS